LANLILRANSAIGAFSNPQSLIVDSGDLILTPRDVALTLSGSLAHGDSFSVNGSNFGIKSLSNMLYDDFTGGTLGTSSDGQTCSHAGTWDVQEGGFPFEPEYDTISRGVHTRGTYHRYEEGAWNCSLNINPPSGTVRAYVDFYARVVSDNGIRSRNQKIWRCYPVSSDNNFDYDAMWYYTTECATTTDTSGYYAGAGGRFFGYDNGDPFSNGRWPINGTWFHIQAGIEMGTNSTANGAWFVTQNCVNFRSENNVIIRNATHASREIRQMRIIHYCASDAGGGSGNDCAAIPGTDIWCSSAYFDYGANSWKRVEAGNNATYSSCTIREIQPLTSWSDTNVQGTFNRGQLSTGTNWLHVIGNDNSVLASQQITVA
jgi:hypothetical protein